MTTLRRQPQGPQEAAGLPCKDRQSHRSPPRLHHSRMRGLVKTTADACERCADRIVIAEPMRQMSGRSGKGQRCGVISISKRSEVEPFHAMDVLAEATRRAESGRPVISLAVGQPAHPAPRAAIDAARARARCRPDRLYGCARTAQPEGGDRPPLRIPPRHRHRARPHRRDHRFFGRLQSRVSGPLQCRRPGRDHAARLSRLSQHPRDARAQGSRDSRRTPTRRSR